MLTVAVSADIHARWQPDLPCYCEVNTVVPTVAFFLDAVYTH